MIQLIVDSTCDMPRSIIQKYQIKVLPLQVIIDGISYRDGVDMSIEELYTIMHRGVFPQTAQVSLKEMADTFHAVCEDGNDFIYLCFSSEMSGTYAGACMLIEKLQREFPDRRMSVVDSEGGCFASGLIAMQTARWIAAGKGYGEVLELMAEMIANIQHLFTLDSLDWLAKGGRVPKPVGWMGDVLNIKPILHVKDKTMHVFDVSRGRKRTIETMLNLLQERAAAFPNQIIGITHADDETMAYRMRDVINEAMPEARTVVIPIGCVLATHLGIGGVGLFFLKQPVTGYDLLDEEL